MATKKELEEQVKALQIAEAGYIETEVDMAYICIQSNDDLLCDMGIFSGEKGDKFLVKKIITSVKFTSYHKMVGYWEKNGVWETFEENIDYVGGDWLSNFEIYKEPNSVNFIKGE